MTGPVYEHLLEALKRGPLTLVQARAIAQECGSSWAESQIHLFLGCMEGVDITQSKEGSVTFRKGQASEQEMLAEAIFEIVRASGGRPAPAAAIKSHLAGRFVTTEEQIRAIARKTPGLEVFGPGLIRLKQ